jgi:DNA repair protein RecO (recombination protein O)
MEETEAIVLKSLDYKDHERILTLFSKEEGRISLIVKGVSSSNHQKLAVTSPFCQAQFFFVRGKSELLRYRDSTILSDNHHLRSHFSHLEAAGLMAKALLDSQLPHKPAPALYALFISYLKNLPNFSNPLPLTTSFFLKMLHHEGLFTSLNYYFTESEQELLRDLLQCQSYKKLQEKPLTEAFAQKVYAHFTASIQGN